MDGEGDARKRRIWPLAVLIAAFVLLAGPTAPGFASSAASCGGSSIYIVAHEDDSFLFAGPTLQQDIDAGRCVETVFVTAGDDGQGSTYWLGREQGAEAAYAQMAGVADTWTESDAGVAGHPMPRVTLSGDPAVSLVFMRLPDGNNDGSGFASTGFESLRDLWTGTISSMGTVDSSSNYTRSTLISTLTGLIDASGADTVYTQDFVGTFGQGDHSDHYATADFTEAAGASDPTPHAVIGFMGYPISSKAANLSASDTQLKEATYFAYAPFDPVDCQNVAACQTNGTAPWWARQYVAGAIEQPATTGADVAPNAVVTASSQTVSTGQLAVKAVDGSSDGYPGDYSHEWATMGEGAGAWLTLTWSSPQTLTSLVLFDRPNLDDQITGGTITFSDGSSLPVGALPNDGSPLTLTFAAKTVTSLTLTVTSVKASTVNVGLAEIQAFTGAGSTPPPPSPTVSGLAPASGPAGTSASISASGFAATHALTVTVGGAAASVSSGGTTNANGNATVAFTVPALAAGPQAVVVSDGTSSATSATDFTVSAVTATNVAPNAVVTASSQTVSTGQLAVKAVDGSSDGYPGDYSHEWATMGEGAGAWLTLTWSSPQTLTSLVLFDRPNLDDQITGGTITFSDGSSLPVGALPNDGSPLTLTFAAKTVTSLTLTVTSVKASTVNVGLAEIQAFTGAGSTPPPPSPTVSGLAPASGPAGTSASISASGFAATHALTVTVGGAAASVSSGGTTNANGNATVAFTVPALAAGPQAVVVSDGTSSATSATDFTVSAVTATNVAPNAVVTASSQTVSTGQLAVKAVDGSSDGYPGDYSHEWATMGEGAGAWLTLTWSSPQTLTSLVLFDRPNLDDQITGGTITFSDGSSLPVGALPNDGSPLTLTFAAKTVTSLTLTVTSVKASTVNVGLAEIQAFA